MQRALDLIQEFSTEMMTQWIEQQIAFGHRQPGTPGSTLCEDFLLQTFQELGLSQVRREKVRDPLSLDPQLAAQAKSAASPQAKSARAPQPDTPIQSWIPLPDLSSLTLHGQAIPFSPIPHTPFTAAEGLEAPLFWLAGNEGGSAPHTSASAPYTSASAPSCRGKIVVVDIHFPPIPASKFVKLGMGHYDPDRTLSEMNHPATWILQGWELYHWAVAQGAVGFLGILRDQPGGEHRLYAPYGFKEVDILDRPIPAAWISRKNGDTLKAAALRGDRVTLRSLGEKPQRLAAYNIVGEIPGDGSTDEVAIITSHHDAPFISPVEDGTGIAVLLALAKYFQERATRSPLRRKLIFVATAGHFYGSVGTRSFIHDHPELLTPQKDGRIRTAFQITIEHVAREAVETADGNDIALNPYGTRSSEHPLRTRIPQAAYRPEPQAIFMSFNRTLRDVMLRALRMFDVDRSLLLGAAGPLGPFPPTDGGDWFAAGIPVINYISNPVYLLTAGGDDRKWVATERLAPVAATFAEVITVLDQESSTQLRKRDLIWQRVKAKMAAARLSF